MSIWLQSWYYAGAFPDLGSSPENPASEMIDTTTSKDLAKKIEWIGLRNLSPSEKKRVASELEDVCRHLPRLLALALWSCFGRRPSENLETRESEFSVTSYLERENARLYIKELMADYQEEESSR